MSRRDGIVKNGLGLPRAVHSLEQNVPATRQNVRGAMNQAPLMKTALDCSRNLVSE